MNLIFVLSTAVTIFYCLLMSGMVKLIFNSCAHFTLFVSSPMRWIITRICVLTSCTLSAYSTVDTFVLLGLNE